MVRGAAMQGDRRSAGAAFGDASDPSADRAREIFAAQNRLRQLLAANEAIVSELSLPVVLRGIVEAACALVDAPFGALGVLAADGSGLDEFIHVGMPESVVEGIGSLPEGKGLLGALIDDPRTIRLSDLRNDLRSVGFPEGHPPLRGFLGTPIRVRGEVFGNLYLANVGEAEFSAEDEELVGALAATAGVAISNARLYEEGERRQRWLGASTDVTRELLTSSPDGPLRLVGEKVLELADAESVTFGVLVGDDVEIVAAVGTGAVALVGTRYPMEATFAGEVLHHGKPVLVKDAQDVGEIGARVIHVAKVLAVGPFMSVPLIGAGGIRGVLSVARSRGRHAFTGADADMALTFANHASIALELSEARHAQQDAALVKARERIAFDLHEHVIGELFGASMQLSGMRSVVGGENTTTVDDVIGHLDDSIRHIRSVVYELGSHVPGPRRGAPD